MLIYSILPKWNPSMENLDLNDELALTTNEEQEWNKEATDEDITVWDLNITLSNITDGFVVESLRSRRRDIKLLGLNLNS
jgi:hypothetical protein